MSEACSCRCCCHWQAIYSNENKKDRKLFAAMAITGIADHQQNPDHDKTAIDAVKLADALLKELAKDRDDEKV